MQACNMNDTLPAAAIITHHVVASASADDTNISNGRIRKDRKLDGKTAASMPGTKSTRYAYNANKL